MIVEPLALNGTYTITTKPIGDERGYFMVTYQKQLMQQHGLVSNWVQENQSHSRQGVVRGLHFQLPPHSETKLIRVLRGAIWDVFADLRTGSPTYGQWDAVELSDQNHRMAYIPKGFAHGFCVLTEDALLSYKVDAAYVPDFQGGLRWNDSTLDIPWPCQNPTLSPRDEQLPDFASFQSPFSFAEYRDPNHPSQ